MTKTADPRTDQLVRSRKRDSETKRRRALETVRQMLESGQRIGFTSVARQAHVSTWLLYSVPELKHAVQQAINAQMRNPMLSSTAKPVLPESISATELALARAEIKELRTANAKLTARLRSTLGAELDLVDREDLIGRIHELEHAVQITCRERDEANATVNRLQDRIAELDEEVAVQEALNKKFIREINLSRRKSSP